MSDETIEALKKELATLRNQLAAVEKHNEELEARVKRLETYLGRNAILPPLEMDGR
jgi:phage shock protein A